MNETSHKIEIFTPFGKAVDLTKKILFEPFNLRKWCVIGFAAFLSGHFGGGFGFRWPMRDFNRRSGIHPSFDFEQWKSWLPVGLLFFFIAILALVVVMMWIRSRGNFIFTDCIVRNRAAIAEPWREYRKEGNSYFLFMLALTGACVAVFAVVFVIVGALGLIRYGQDHTSMTASVVFFVCLFLFWFGIVAAIVLISYFMAPVMYRQRCDAVHAFRQVIRLMADNAAVFFLFLMFAVVLFLAMMMIGAIVSCLTCCLATLPYIGSVILLPVFVCLRAFGLLFLQQFGPDYDVWATLPPPLPTPAAP